MSKNMNIDLLESERFKEQCLKIINTYGVDLQLRKLNEENFEVMEAIIHGDPDHIGEEIADNLLMLFQFMFKYDITLDDVFQIMVFKIRRTHERIDGDGKETGVDNGEA